MLSFKHTIAKTVANKLGKYDPAEVNRHLNHLKTFGDTALHHLDKHHEVMSKTKDGDKIREKSWGNWAQAWQDLSDEHGKFAKKFPNHPQADWKTHVSNYDDHLRKNNYDKDWFLEH